MAMRKEAGVSDEAVRAKTGRTWGEWFAILDGAGARKMEHGAIARYLNQKRGVREWWCQMVTVGYEQARGLRQKYQKASGYAVGASKTVGVPVAALFEAWADPKARRRWLKAWKFQVRKATRNKSMRITWVDGKTHVDVYFLAKGKGKSLVSVEHRKLADRKQAERMKEYWGWSLEKMSDLVI